MTERRSGANVRMSVGRFLVLSRFGHDGGTYLGSIGWSRAGWVHSRVAGQRPCIHQRRYSHVLLKQRRGRRKSPWLGAGWGEARVWVT